MKKVLIVGALLMVSPFAYADESDMEVIIERQLEAKGNCEQGAKDGSCELAATLGDFLKDFGLCYEADEWQSCGNSLPITMINVPSSELRVSKYSRFNYDRITADLVLVSSVKDSTGVIVTCNGRTELIQFEVDQELKVENGKFGVFHRDAGQPLPFSGDFIAEGKSIQMTSIDGGVAALVEELYHGGEFIFTYREEPSGGYDYLVSLTLSPSQDMKRDFGGMVGACKSFARHR